MDKRRLLELAGVQLDEANNTQLAMSLSTGDLVEIVAYHMWQEFFQDGDVKQFMDDVNRELQNHKEKGKP